MPADVRIVQWTGEYGPNLEGFFKKENPRPLDHNIHIREEVQPGVATYWDFAPRPKYRLWEQPLSVANIGDEPMELGNIFNAPQWYQPIQGPKWAVLIKGLFSYAFDLEAPKPMKVIILWDTVPAGPSFPKVPSSFLDVKLSPGWGAGVVEYAYAPIDITDLPDGQHMFSLSVSPPNSGPHTVSFEFTINRMDLRLI